MGGFLDLSSHCKRSCGGSNGKSIQLKQPDNGKLTNNPDVNYDGDASIITADAVHLRGLVGGHA